MKERSVSMGMIGGIVIAVLLISYNTEIKLVSVETGIRDKVVNNLKSWKNLRDSGNLSR